MNKPSDLDLAKDPISRDQFLKSAGLATIAALFMKCKDPTPKPNGEQPKLQDTPEKRVEFMKDVKPAVLGGGVATLDFDAIWVGDKYELLPKSIITVTKAIKELEQYAVESGKAKEELAFYLYYSDGTRGNGVRIGWGLPYNDLIQMQNAGSTTINLNMSDFNKYLLKSDVLPNGGNPKASVTKNIEGYLEISILSANNTKIAKELQIISPYSFGKQY